MQSHSLTLDFVLIIIVAKLFTEGHSFDCIRPMVNFSGSQILVP